MQAADWWWIGWRISSNRSRVPCYPFERRPKRPLVLDFQQHRTFARVMALAGEAWPQAEVAAAGQGAEVGGAWR
jgi:hypothetical protein